MYGIFTYMNGWICMVNVGRYTIHWVDLFLEELHFVMEYMSGGELYKRLSSRKRYSEESQKHAETTTDVGGFWGVIHQSTCCGEVR